MPPKEKYTDPKLRDKVKQEIQDSDKGGAPGQWSARKAQMMASEYKKRGGEYNADKSEKDESQKNLDKWGEEDWQTKEGSGHAKEEDGTEKRYLPKKAWEDMSEQEKEATDKKKQEGSGEGKQHVGNTDKAKESRKRVTNNGQDSQDGEEDGRKQNGNAEQNDDKEYEDQDDDDDNDDDGSQNSDEEDSNGDDHGEQEDEDVSAGQKRSKQSNGSSKKQKTNSGEGKQQQQQDTVGSKHQPAKEPAPRGSKDRLPNKGQSIQWKAMPGYVDGEVVEVLTQGKTVDGKSVKASKDDPKIVLKSNSSGKICVHKPDACFFG